MPFIGSVELLDTDKAEAISEIMKLISHNLETDMVFGFNQDSLHAVSEQIYEYVITRSLPTGG